MKIKNPFKTLSKFEIALWLSSIVVTIISYLVNGQGFLSLVASLIGATGLIFVAKGNVFGQALCIVFAFLYGYISLTFKYYGEMITYVFMSGPMAIFSLITWLKNPYGNDKSEVKVKKRLSRSEIAVMLTVCFIVTLIFYFILKYFNTANLILSTFSITTSFLACWLTMLRSPFYAIAYSANDIILIALWILASITDLSYLPMVACFVVFLVNDMYGFYNWRRILKRQVK